MTHTNDVSFASLYMFSITMSKWYAFEIYSQNMALLPVAHPTSRKQETDQQRDGLPKHGRVLDVTPLRQRDNMFIVRSILLLMRLKCIYYCLNVYLLFYVFNCNLIFILILFVYI